MAQPRSNIYDSLLLFVRYTIGALMTREAISTSAAATVVGPYSQAIVAGGFVFCSGTAGIDPDTGEVREGVRAQTEQALTNLAAIL